MSIAPLPQGDWIRGISVQQPHATRILTGAKGIENRPRPWRWRGWMLLHAGQRIDRSALRVPLIARTIRGRELTTGAVIGVVRLVDCHQDREGSAGKSGYQNLRNRLRLRSSVTTRGVHDHGHSCEADEGSDDVEAIGAVSVGDHAPGDRPAPRRRSRNRAVWCCTAGAPASQPVC